MTQTDEPHVLLLASERFSAHETPAGHPERPGRAEVMTAVAARWQAAGGDLAAPSSVDDDVLVRVHAAGYVDDITATAGARVRLDPDTWTSPESAAVARLAAGAAIGAVEHTLAHNVPALAFVRPPGHHAERERALGFCLYNNVAIAAAHARAAGIERVAIVDYDVHHGNGTQWMFFTDPNVLYVSTHQYPFYPGTGAADDIGREGGEGFTLNVPLEAGATDGDFDRVFVVAVEPVLREFAPELLLISAGFDGHERDPLGGMKLTTPGYTRLTERLRRLAVDLCDNRVAVVTEGGYDLPALSGCLAETLRVMREPAPETLQPLDGATSRSETALTAVRAAQGAFWRTL